MTSVQRWQANKMLKKCAPKNAPVPQITGIGPDNYIYYLAKFFNQMICDSKMHS